MSKLTILFISLILLAGCGQKGPLYHAGTEPEKESNQPKKDSNQPIPEPKEDKR
ncbi:MAG: lipoprotein [Psychrobium sp.]|nr:lipoprotein [Psychrobium sp.]